MNGSEFINRILNILDSLVDPHIVSVADISRDYGLIVVIAMGFMYYGMTRVAFKDMPKSFSLVIGLVLTVSAATMTGAYHWLVFLAGIVGSLIKMIGGASLVRDALRRKAAGIILLVLVVLSIPASMIWVSSLGIDDLVLLKIVLSVFGGIGAYHFFIHRDLDFRYSRESLVGLAVLVGFAGLVSFDGMLPFAGDNILIKIGHGIMFKYSFGVGMGIGLLVWLTDR